MSRSQIDRRQSHSWILNGIAVGDAIGKQTETLSPADVARWYPDGVRGFEGPPGEIRQLTQLSDRGFLNHFDITPDGKHLVFDRSRQNSGVVLIDLPKK